MAKHSHDALVRRCGQRTNAIGARLGWAGGFRIWWPAMFAGGRFASPIGSSGGMPRLGSPRPFVFPATRSTCAMRKQGTVTDLYLGEVSRRK